MEELLDKWIRYIERQPLAVRCLLEVFSFATVLILGLLAFVGLSVLLGYLAFLSFALIF